MTALANLPDRTDLVSPRELSSYLYVSLQTLAKWRAEGKGPPFYKLGDRRIVYSLSGVVTWLQTAGQTLLSEQDEWT